MEILNNISQELSTEFQAVDSKTTTPGFIESKS